MAQICGWRTTMAVFFGVFFGLLMAAPILANERGRTPAEVFVMQDLRVPANTNSVTALPDGRLLISNTGALMSFDGATWQKYRHPLGTGYLTGLAFSDSDTLYAGWQSELGWFKADDFGEFKWHSLLDHVAIADRGMGDVTKVLLDPKRGGVWYISDHRVFFWDIQREILTKVAETRAITASLVDGEVWLSTVQSLLKLTSTDPAMVSALPEVQGSEVFSGRTTRKVIADPAGKLIVQANALYWRANQQSAFKPFATELTMQFNRDRIADVIRLRNGRWAVLLQNSQILLLDDSGLAQAEFGVADGIAANPAKAIFEDRFGSLWLAQERTVSVLHLGRGLSRFDAADGLPGADSLARWNGALMVGQTKALYRMSPSMGMTSARFDRVLPNLLSAICMASTFAGKRLFVAGYGLHEITSKSPNDPYSELSAKQLTDMRVCNRMEASRFVEGRIWVAHSSGLLRVDMSATGEPVLTPMPQVNGPVDALAEIDANQLLLSAHGRGTWRIASAAGVNLPEITDNLPDGSVKLFPGKTKPWVLTQKGMWQFDPVSARFEMPPHLPPELRSGKIFSILEEQTGQLWVRGTGVQGGYLPNLTQPAIDVSPQQTSAAQEYVRGDTLDGLSVADRTIFRFLREGNILWLSRSDDLLRIDLAAQQSLPFVLPPRLISIEDLSKHTPVSFSAASQLAATVRNLRISFALPSSLRSSENTYRSKLNSVDTNWSPWSARTDREYSTLPFGAQQFYLEARDGLGRISRMPPLTLSITPPWFRSRFAYSTYVGLALFALWLATRLGGHWRQRTLLIRQRELETIVSERTDELYKKNNQLAEQTQRLQEVDRLKTRFFINVGHEFRTPLTLVLGPVDDLLKDRKEHFTDRVRDQLSLIHRNAKRVLDLIVELLDVNRFEHGQLKLHPVVTDASVLLKRIAGDALEFTQRFGHKLVLDLPEQPCLVHVDEAQIERALGNLLSNAAKYMARGGTITLTLYVNKEHVEIQVRDQGRGIAPSALAHVFDRFFQAEGGDQASGYGIGLALVREIVEANDGQISVESALGVGSCFYLRFPESKAVPGAFLSAPPNFDKTQSIDNRKSPTAATMLPASAVTRGNPADISTSKIRQRVLVVDDHDDMRLRVCGLFSEQFEVLQAADGPSAWQLAQAELPDLIVADVMMPGFDGVELTKRIRANADTAAIGLLLLTAKVGSEHAVAGLSAGANDYLAKPFDASELLARADAILAHAQRLRLQLNRDQPASSALNSAINASAISSDVKWRQRLDQLIAAKLDDPEFSIESLADAMHADRSQLLRKCKSILSMSPSEYLRNVRMQRAQVLLAQAAGTISEVAYAVGFESLSSFTRTFKAHFGQPPSAVRSAKTA